MARQNVGTPKFYIDLLSYWQAKGNIKGAGFPYESDPEIHHVGGDTYHANLIGLNPTDYVKQDFEYDPNEIIRVEFKEDILVPHNSSDQFFFGYLGHNFKNLNLKDLKLKVHSNDSNETADINYSDLVNFFEHFGWNMDGWSLASFYDLGDISISYIDFEMTSPFAENSGVREDIETYIGSLAFGSIFEMPNSPDLELTMSRTYEGISSQQTRGGSTLTQINYSKPADWLGRPAWELYEIGVSEPGTRYSARGRRSWALSFSYIDGDDLFAVNESAGVRYEETTSAGYSSSDFSGNQFTEDMMRSNSFLAVVMEKTMGGALPFIFQPDGNINAPDQFAICTIDQNSFTFNQVANNVYSVSMNITETW